ncbi:MAG TPA: trigger factor [Planktothrix sp.]
MKVNLDREGKNLVKLGLELEAEKALKAYEVACRQLSHQVNIPGFRRGKAPRNIIEKTLGVDFIKREALERLVPELLRQAITDESLDVITEPEIDKCEYELGAPLKLSAKFEVRPEVKLGDYKGIEVEVPEAKLPADALDRALQSIAESKSSLAPIPARPVKMGDTVLLDFECLVDGKLVDGGKAEGLVLEVKEGSFIEGFCDQLVGKEPEQKFDINVKFPDEYRNKELANKDANFKVELREIRERSVPDVNDELATAVGQENLDKLKEALQERLNDEVSQENEMRSQRRVVEAVVASSHVDIPETMIERERDLLLQQVRRYVEQNKQSWEEFQQRPEFEQLKSGKQEEARQRVLTSLVLGAVVRAEQMSIVEDEMAPYFAELVARYNVPVEQIARNEELRRQVMEEVLTNKVVYFLMSNAKINYVPEPEVPEHVHGENCDHEQEEKDEAKAEKAESKAKRKAPAKS